ncbi:hypothetical protein BDV93DRAFT_274941 [Ceratobasidium sp. AG-I]|nr:hypothetical protein BDV93DRAFT_274941 [Ceratobasidium sp. AG-I]
MSRANSVERERKPLPPVPQPAQPTQPTVPNTNSVAESSHTTVTERLAQTLKKMSADIPTTEYRSPLNIAGRVRHELSDLSREIPVVSASRTGHHDYRTPKDRHKPDTPPEDIALDRHQPPGEIDTVTSAEKIRRNWEESQRPLDHEASKPSRDPRGLARHRSATSPPTAYPGEQGFPWNFNSRDRDRHSRRNSSRSRHRRERSEEQPRDVEIYDNSDDSDPPSPRLEIHNATPIYEGGSMKSRSRPGLTTRFRSSLQRIGVGATRPARQRTNISRSPSPNTNSRSPSPNTWRKPSPHSSLRAAEQFGTPRAAGFPDPLPRIESQKMDINWGEPLVNDPHSPPRPPDDAIPTIPDLNTPGIYQEHGPRNVPIIDGDRQRSVEIHDHLPSHLGEHHSTTAATAASLPHHRDRYQDTLAEPTVVRNVGGSRDPYEGRDNAPGRLKRLLSLNSKPMPPLIDDADGQPAPVGSTSPPRSKVYSTTSGIIRSTSLIRTRSRRKEVPKIREQRVDPDVQVEYESDGWGEGRTILRDAQGNEIVPPAPKRRTSQKGRTTGPTKIVLPMGGVEEFHSVHEQSPYEHGPQDLSASTRPGSPARKLSGQSTRQAKPNVSDPKYDGWRRSRAGAPRRPSQTLLVATPSGNQYADEEPLAQDPQPILSTEERDPYSTHHAKHYPEHHPERHLEHRPDHQPDYHLRNHPEYRPEYNPEQRLEGRSELRPEHPSERYQDYRPEDRPEDLPDHRPEHRPERLAERHPEHSDYPQERTDVANSLPSRALSPPPVAHRSHSPIPHEPVVHVLPAQNPPIRTPPPRDSPGHMSPEQSPPVLTPRAQSPPLGDNHVRILPHDSTLGEHPTHGDTRYNPHLHTQVVADMRSPVLDTPTYVLPRMPTPTLTSPGVLLNPPSAMSSPTIERQLSPRPYSPARDVPIEYGDHGPESTPDGHPIPRSFAVLSGAEQQRREQYRKTGSEMSYVTVEPLTKREKLAASVLSLSSKPWLRARLSSARSHHYADSSYHSTHDDGDSRFHDRHRQHTDYMGSPTAPQLPAMSTTPPPRPEVGKLPSWYPREQAARAAGTPPARESRGPRVGQEAWGWRSSPHHGIPEEHEGPQPVNMPPWPYAGGVVTPGPEISNNFVRGESVMTPPMLPPRPVNRTPEPGARLGAERKRTPKYRIEQDSHGHPVLIPEPGFDDNRWTVFEIGGIEFKKDPVPGDGAKSVQWVPKPTSGLRHAVSRGSLNRQYSDSPAPMHASLEGRHYDT